MNIYNNNQNKKDIDKLFNDITNLNKPLKNSFIGILYQQILTDNINLQKVATTYLAANNDENYYTSTTYGLLRAYIQYKQNQIIDPYEAWYLSTRSGGSCWPIYDDNSYKYTVRNIICILDGDGFINWLYFNAENIIMDDEDNEDNEDNI